MTDDDITDFPLAYLITFRCYGTLLHGDKRGIERSSVPPAVAGGDLSSISYEQ